MSEKGREFRPYPYQQRCIDKICSREATALFLDCGLGKTAITLMAVKALKYERLAVSRVLVIAPKKVAEATWTEEARTWKQTEDLTFSKILGSAVQREKALEQEADIYLVNRENVKWLVDRYMKKGKARKDWPFDMVVIDESSGFKNPKAQRVRALAKVRPQIDRIVELTGTPSPNGLLDLWSQIYLLDRGERLGSTFGGYRERYFDPGRRNQQVIYEWIAKPGAADAVLQKLSDICVSMSADEYLQLPDLIYDDVSVELTPAARKQYDEMERQMILNLPESEITAFSAAALTNKLQQMANGAVYDEYGVYHEVHVDKLEMLTELLERLGEQHAVIYYTFRHDLERLRELLPEARELEGEGDIRDWNAGKIKYLLAHPASAGYGLNLQQGGHHIIWFGLTWSYEQYLQANKRLHRQGQQDTVIVHHIVCKDTVDEIVLKALGLKEKGQNYVLEALKAKKEELKSVSD
jgi:SNF2 family DNA or RNA helicase